MSVKVMCRPIYMLSMASDLNYEQAVWTQYESSEILACVHWVSQDVWKIQVYHTENVMHMFSGKDRNYEFVLLW